MKKAKAGHRSSQPNKVVPMPHAAAARWYRSAVVLLPALIFVFGALDHLWVTEDAFITFRSVENFWAGYGPNFNKGLRVESFSHPLWFLILSALRAAGLSALPFMAAGTGVFLAIAGLVAATQAARLRLERLPRLAPLGALAVAVLPPFWDFASSGLETGLAFAWIGAVSLLLTLVAREHRPRAVGALFWTLGLSPLIRPDMALPAVPLTILGLLLSRAAGEGLLPSLGRLLRVALPGLGWQIFRMGYYGLTVPNTFLAKEGFLPRWDQGLIYLNDLYLLYWLYPLVALLLALTGISSFYGARRSAGRTASFASSSIPLALALAGALHSLAVVRTGGDFMHARLLLPGLFFFLAAGAVVALPSNSILRALALGAVGTWALAAALLIRPPYGASVSSDGIADEREWYVLRSRTVRPISLKDYQFHSFSRIGEEVSRMAHARGINVVYWAHIGITVASIADDLTVIDPLALNDHIGSHIEIGERGRPGHEKIVRAAWFTARYPPNVGMVVRNQLDGKFGKAETPEAVLAAKAVLGSAKVAELTEAVSAPLTWELFWRNVSRAPRLTALRIPADPIAAQRAP